VGAAAALVLQALVNADPSPGRFILTGSQQFELMTQARSRWPVWPWRRLVRR
jgi:hypothetical protein